MKYFKQLDLPIYVDLYNCLQQLEADNTISWLRDPTDKYSKIRDQICINSYQEHSNNYTFGVGSLIYDWDATKTVDGSLVVPKRDIPLEENKFTVVCDQFKDTPFEEFYNTLTEHYAVGRVRIMRSEPKTCLTWHKDDTPRLHYPLKTQDGCIMVIEDEVHHMPANTWWLTDTTVSHTAFNGSRSDRYHIVATILNK
jgi:hypothetical protein